MAVRWRKGFFRTWILLTAIWLFAVSLFYWDSVYNPRISEFSYGILAKTGEPNRIDRFSVDYEYLDERAKTGELDVIELGELRNVVLFIKSDTALDEKQRLSAIAHADALAFIKQQTSDRRFETIMAALIASMLPPAILFALVFGFTWALTGFRP